MFQPHTINTLPASDLYRTNDCENINNRYIPLYLKISSLPSGYLFATFSMRTHLTVDITTLTITPFLFDEYRKKLIYTLHYFLEWKKTWSPPLCNTRMWTIANIIRLSMFSFVKFQRNLVRPRICQWTAASLLFYLKHKSQPSRCLMSLSRAFSFSPLYNWSRNDSFHQLKSWCY